MLCGGMCVVVRAHAVISLCHCLKPTGMPFAQQLYHYVVVVGGVGIDIPVGATQAKTMQYLR
jgi:hypothetical protein